mmetsp:Transcript_6163/g.13523  ORF Transcript_6163/g.13523 Transcript_6163/m.13523 type:complete len:423 (+) Transcript_6163:159-1427(+)
MKLSLALLCAAVGYSAASPFAPKKSRNTRKAKMNAKLMSNAKTLRKLDQQDEEQEVDLSGYSIKFEKCQFVKSYNGEEGGGGGEGVDTILTTQRFVIFRLCPDSSCSSCNYNYGEYIVDMETYLEAALGYKEEAQEQYCDTCNECYEKAAEAAENDDANEEEEEDEDAWKCQNMDTSSCYAECQNIENMEENGYMDASEFIECQELDVGDDDGVQLFAGAMCASSGTRIKIGIFSDEDCSIYDESKDIEDYMKNGDGYNMKLSYHLLKQTYSEGECVANCLVEDEEQNNQNDEGDDEEEKEAEINEMCEELYEAAGKCETNHGFEQGIVDYDNYDNQIRNEELVCDFISSLKAGQYDQTGEIVVSGGRTTLGGSSTATGGQKFALTFFILGSVGLAGYSAMLHQQLTKGAKADLAGQGGALA